MKGVTNAIVSGRKADFFLIWANTRPCLPLRYKTKRGAQQLWRTTIITFPYPRKPSLLHNRILTSSYPKPTLLLLAGASSAGVVVEPIASSFIWVVFF
jgi:hypothetical protein